MPSENNFVSKVKAIWNNPEHRAVFTYSGANNFAYNLIAQFYMTVNSIFLTDVAKVGVIMTGGIQTLQPLIKMCTAGITGMLFDKQPFKKGRFYPWLQLLTPLLFVLFLLYFFAPMLSIERSALIPILIVLTIAASIVQNMLFTVTYAIYPLVTYRQDYRIAGSTTSNIFKEGGKLAVGSLYPLLLVLFFKAFNSDATSYFLTYVVLGLGFVIIMLYASSEVKKSGVENRNAASKGTVHIKDMLLAFVGNPALILTFVLGVLMNIRNMGLSPLAPYYFKYVLKDPAGLAVFLSALSVISVLFLFLAPFVLKVFKEQKYVASATYFLCGLCHLLVAWTGLGNSTIGVSIVLGISQGLSSIISIIILNLYASASDYGEWKTGKSNPGVSMSVFSIGIQVGALCATFVRTAGLKSIGYAADMVITPQVQEGFTGMISYMLAVPVLIAAVLVLFHPATNKRLAQLRKETSPCTEEQTSEK